MHTCGIICPNSVRFLNYTQAEILTEKEHWNFYMTKGVEILIDIELKASNEIR